jgi:tetratricopeptide (TPR) repeat protein|tara:strand:- start:2012 stop:3232 length:1221 start_codon:yes stop_codon:yes gene_type:complete
MKNFLFILIFTASALVYAVPQSSSPTLSTYYYYELIKIDKKMLENRNEEVEADLLDLLDDDFESRSYNHAVLLKKYAFFLITQDRTDEGLLYLKAALKKRALEAIDTHNIMYVIAQITASQGNYQEAIDYLLEWMELGNNRKFALNPRGIALIGISYAQLENYKKSLFYISDAIERSNFFVEGWHELKFALHYRMDEFELALETSQDLVRNAPKKKKYLDQMGGMYNILKFEIESLSSLEFGLTQDLLKKEKDYLLLANFYMYKQVPFDATKTLELGFKRNIIKRSSENLETLSNAYISSRDKIKAADTLKEASKLSEKPELSFRLGQVEMSLSRWDKAIDSFKAAKTKGWKKEKGKIEYFIGISLIELEKYNEASKYLSQSVSMGQEKIAKPWLEYIDYLEKTSG